MKKLLFFILLHLTWLSSFAQTTSNKWPSTGNAGVNMTSLHPNANYPFEIRTSKGYSGKTLRIASKSEPTNFYLDLYAGTVPGEVFYEFNLRNKNFGLINDVLVLRKDGVGIFTDSPVNGYKLSVNGGVTAEEVRVQAVGADFVFEDDYSLPTLSEVEGYIQEHRHLPEIPSAQQMQQDGVKLGELNMLLLQKVEELTLYTISQQKQIEALQAQVNQRE